MTPASSSPVLRLPAVCLPACVRLSSTVAQFPHPYAGGPALQGDMVAGVAFQNLPHADSIGYIIPTPVVRLFLAEVAQYGHYKGGRCGPAGGMPLLMDAVPRSAAKVRCPVFMSRDAAGGCGIGPVVDAQSLLSCHFHLLVPFPYPPLQTTILDAPPSPLPPPPPPCRLLLPGYHVPLSPPPPQATAPWASCARTWRTST